MKKTPFTSVDAYLAMQPDEARPILTRVRDTIRKALPRGEESISYNIPTYKVHGRPVIYFAGWKRHYSLYPVSRLLLDALGDELAQYEIEKGTIRFPLDEPVPVRLIAAIAKQRAKEEAAGE